MARASHGKGEERSQPSQINLSSALEYQPSKRASYVAVAKGSKENETNSRPTNAVPTSPQLHHTVPKVIESAPTDSRQRNSSEQITPFVPTNTSSVKGWVLFFQTATSMICTLLESVDAEWAQSIHALLRTVIPLIRLF